MRTLIIVCRMASFLVMTLSGLSLDACLGWVVGDLIFGEASPFFWIFSFGETVVMSIGATVSGGLGIYTAFLLDTERRH
jgi:hypothetical protein